RCTGCLIVGLVVAHAAGLLGAAGGVCLGIKVENYPLAAEVRQLDSAAVLVGELEVGGLLAGLDHGARCYPVAYPAHRSEYAGEWTEARVRSRPGDHSAT